VSLTRPAPQPAAAPPAATSEPRWSLATLLLASFLTLFAELALIRWIAVEVRIFAYMKNLALLLCFLGFGFGCALARKRIRWWLSIEAFVALLFVIRALRGRGSLEALSQMLGASADVQIWGANINWSWPDFLRAAFIIAVLMLLVICVFIPLGQTVSLQLDLASRRLRAYSWNLAASLAGIVVFLVICKFMLPPAFWLPLVPGGFALLVPGTGRKIVAALFMVPAVLLLYQPAQPNRVTMWTPYQKIDVRRFTFPDGEFFYDYVEVNHTGYQVIVNLSQEFLDRHPRLSPTPMQDNPYNLPFRFASRAPSVLVVGAGTGNDTAAALRNGSSHVDAVEIDPAIRGLGRAEHPEKPYDSPRVSFYLTDARAFLRRTRQSYDLILFGLLDAHTTFSDYSNMRIDNFVYTEESFREARARLKPDGVLFVKFQVDRPWLAKRMKELLTSAFGKPPLVFYGAAHYSFPATCFVISPGNRVEQALAKDPPLASLVKAQPAEVATEPVPPTTDDWPYLYQQHRSIPRTYYTVALLLMILAVALYLLIPETRQHAPSLFYFCMGAGFLLLETQVISRLALYFGTVWQVSGIVIAALLTALLLANFTVEWTGLRLSSTWIWGGLILTLIVVYLLPMNRLPGSASAAGALAAAIFSVPVFFAGLLFALEFRKTASPSASLGANMLGAVLGGFLENLSLITGTHALLLVAIVIYGVAGGGLFGFKQRA
jgi:SAM-dependent methyltransferase